MVGDCLVDCLGMAGSVVKSYTWLHFPRGAVVAIAMLSEVWRITESGLIQNTYPAHQGQPMWRPLPEEPERSFGDYTPGRYAWELTCVLRLPQPIPAKGAQGLWNWTDRKFVPIIGYDMAIGQPTVVAWGYEEEKTGIKYLRTTAGESLVAGPAAGGI